MDANQLTRRRHNLPHIQQGGSVYFVTFCSRIPFLPSEARNAIIDVVRSGDGLFFDLGTGVVMPDHVHLLFTPKLKTECEWHDLSDILKGIKGTSARRINLVLQRSGPVWQRESYDRIIRSSHDLREKWAYIVENPVRSGLVLSPEDYPFYLHSKDPFAWI